MSTEYVHAEQLVYKGKHIIAVDFSYLTSEQFVGAINHNTQVIVNRGERDLLMLLNATGLSPTPEAYNACKSSAKNMGSYATKVAVFGIQSIFLPFFNYLTSVFKMDVRLFKDEVSAKKWLVQADDG